MASPPDAARDLLRDAFARRYRYEPDFPGFRATCRFQVACGTEYCGGVELTGAGAARVLEPSASQPGEPAAGAWLAQELRAISRTLWSHDFERGEGKFAMSLDETPHPLGPLVMLHGDPHAATFRVRKRRITMATRRQEALVEVVRVDRWYVRPDGRSLPAQFHAEIWDGARGPLRSDRYWDRYWPVGEVLFPQVRRVESTDERGATTSSWLTLRSWQPV
jgi:hypothetical protein